MKCLICKEEIETSAIDSMVEQELNELGIVSRHGTVCRDCQTNFLFSAIDKKGLTFKQVWGIVQ